MSKQRDSDQALILECVNLHERLHRAGLHDTGHAMHEVVQKIGYEVAAREVRRERKERGE